MTSPSKLLRVKDVAAMLSVSESAIYKWVAEGRFPKPFKLSDANAKRASSRWYYEDIEAWLESRREG